MDYRFIDKDPVVDLIRTAFQRDGRTIKEIAPLANLATDTIRRLLYGDTRRPQHRTVAVLFQVLKVNTKYYQEDGKELRVAQEIWRHFVKRQKKKAA